MSGVVPAWPSALKVPAKPARAPVPACLIGSDDSAWAYGELANAMADLRAADPGGRNASLNTAAHFLGGIAAVQLLGKAEVESALLSACHANGLVRDDTLATCLATIRSGYAAGRKSPRHPPPPPVDTDRDFDNLDDPIDDEIAFLLGDGPKPEPKPAKAAGGLTFLSPAERAGREARRYVVKGLVAESDVAATRRR